MKQIINEKTFEYDKKKYELKEIKEYYIKH